MLLRTVPRASLTDRAAKGKIYASCPFALARCNKAGKRGSLHPVAGREPGCGLPAHAIHAGSRQNLSAQRRTPLRCSHEQALDHGGGSARRLNCGDEVARRLHLNGLTRFRNDRLADVRALTERRVARIVGRIDQVSQRALGHPTDRSRGCGAHERRAAALPSTTVHRPGPAAPRGGLAVGMWGGLAVGTWGGLAVGMWGGLAVERE